MRFRLSWIATGCASLLWSSAPAAAQARFVIKPIAYFGDDGGTPARGNLPADAGMITRVGLVRELGNRGVAVYDPGMKRIVVFDSNAKVVRHIGRQGKGPGEFTQVLSMDYDAGRIAVFDYGLARVTIFDTTGRVIKSMRTESANHIVLRGDTVWGANRFSKKHALWAQSINDDATRRVEMLPVTTPNPNFNPPGTGSFFAVARDNNGGTLIAHDLPGLFYLAGRTSGIGEVLGSELFPGARHWPGDSRSPAQIDGLVGLGPNWIGLLVLQFEKDRKPPEPSLPRKLAVFQRDGKFISYAAFPDRPASTVATSILPQEFYYVVDEPYYRIVRAKLEEVRN